MGKKGWVALWLTGLLLLGQAEQLPAVPADGTAALSQQRYVALTLSLIHILLRPSCSTAVVICITAVCRPWLRAPVKAA